MSLTIPFGTDFVIAGIPRSGTRLLWTGITDKLWTGDKNGKPSIKTHNMAPKTAPSSCKCFFIFGDPVLSIISTKLKRNAVLSPRHLQNCESEYTIETLPDIYDEDALNYERMFDTWTNAIGYPVMCLRYETLYNYIGVIEHFVHAHTYFPKWKARSSMIEDQDSDDINRIRKTYASLIEKIRKFPDITIRGL